MSRIQKNRWNEEFDDKCGNILLYMVSKHVYEADKIRYNQLYREINKLFKMSKPTFNAHLDHLKEKNVVTRLESGKQTVYLYLNENNLMIENTKDMQEEIEKEMKLFQAMHDKSFWDFLPSYYSLYFALCELRRTKIMFRYVLTPSKVKENLLAFQYQAMREENMMVELVSALDHAKNRAEKERLVKQIIFSLDKAIEETRNRMKIFQKEH